MLFVYEKIIRFKAAIAGLFLASFCVACSDTSNVYQPQEWADVLQDAGGWIPLPIPDSKYRPGSIISIREDGVRWIDTLESCDIPVAELLEVSSIPGVSFTKSIDFSANVLMNIKGITAGPGFAHISKVGLNITDHGADALRLIQFKLWLNRLDDPELRAAADVCLDELAVPDRYIVTEAFRVSSGTYTLYDENGGQLKLSAPKLGKLLQFESDVQYQVTSSGGLTIDSDTYFAVRGAYRVGDSFRARGDVDVDRLPSGDDLLRQSFVAEPKP